MSFVGTTAAVTAAVGECSNAMKSTAGFESSSDVPAV